MIAEGVSEGLFHITEDVSPQHVTTTLDALKSVKNTQQEHLDETRINKALHRNLKVE